MERNDLDWEWSKSMGLSKAVELAGVERLLVCSGQSAMAEDGSPPLSDDVGEQARLALENLDTVLANGGMTPEDVVRITVYTTDVDRFMAAYRLTVEAYFGDDPPAMTVLGVTALAFPQLKVQIEAIAAA